MFAKNQVNGTRTEDGNLCQQPSTVVVAAVAKNRVIGRGNALPWHLKSDLRHFREKTIGKPVIMGRRTFDSIGKPLPRRSVIVMTRDPDFAASGVRVVHDLAEAIRVGREIAHELGVCEVVVAGGAEIYAQALPHAERLSLTWVDASPDGDTFFPILDPDHWREAAREDHPPGEGDEAAYSFVDYERA